MQPGPSTDGLRKDDAEWLMDVAESEEVRRAAEEYLDNAFEDVAEASAADETVRGNPWQDIASMHVRRNEFLLKEAPVHDQNDHRACLQARLLNIVREKRLNKLQAMITSGKHENHKPFPLFCNAKEFHDESYQAFIDEMNRRVKAESGEPRTR